MWEALALVQGTLNARDSRSPLLSLQTDDTGDQRVFNKTHLSVTQTDKVQVKTLGQSPGQTQPSPAGARCRESRSLPSPLLLIALAPPLSGRAVNP